MPEPPLGTLGEQYRWLARYNTWMNVSAGTREHPLWWAATHFFNHQTHHRGQATTLLKQLGRDPGATDFMVFVWDAQRRPSAP